MFGISSGELLVILLVAFLLVPVRDLPALIRKTAYLLGRLSRLQRHLENYAHDFQVRMEAEAEAEAEAEEEAKKRRDTQEQPQNDEVEEKIGGEI